MRTLEWAVRIGTADQDEGIIEYWKGNLTFDLQTCFPQFMSETSLVSTFK